MTPTTTHPHLHTLIYTDSSSTYTHISNGLPGSTQNTAAKSRCCGGLQQTVFYVCATAFFYILTAYASTHGQLRCVESLVRVLPNQLPFSRTSTAHPTYFIPFWHLGSFCLSSRGRQRKTIDDNSFKS